MTTMSDRLSVGPARIVTPDRVVTGEVIVEGDRIVAVKPTDDESPERLVLPGLIDLHGDDVERHLFPRAGAQVDLELALSTCDRANAAAGVTTKFHAVAFETAPDEQRSVDLAAAIVDGVDAADGTLVDNRVHARCELSEPDAVDAVRDVLNRDVVDLVSVMSHVPGAGQFADIDAFRRRYEDGWNCTPEATERNLERRRQGRASLGRRARQLVREAASAGVPVASHDDERPETVERFAAWGGSISEYPTTMAAARRAAALELTTAMGAPNLVRGGSMWGNLAAIDAIEADIVDVLCSDYHPPSLLSAVFVDTGEPLPRRVERVTAAPADAVGLSDRGRIEPGARADLIVVEPTPVPTVCNTIRAGSDVYRATPPASSSEREKPEPQCRTS